MAKSPAPFDQGLFLMHLHKGKEYFDQNQLQKAKTELESAFNLRPQDDKVLNMLGMTYFKLELLPQAEEMYVALAANNPDIYTLQSNLGLIRFKLEKLPEAEESLRRALELQPTNPKAHFYLGLLYEKMGRWQEALDHFHHAKAEKMISKIQQKMTQDTKKPDTLLSFEVLEVLEEQEMEAERTEMIRPVEHSQMPDRDPFAPQEEEQTMLLSKEAVRSQSGWIERDFTSTLRQVQEEVFPGEKPADADLVHTEMDSEEGTMFFTRDEFNAAKAARTDSVPVGELQIPAGAMAELSEISSEELPAGFREEERATLEREWVEDGFGTGKMRRRDVMEVMDRLEEQEPEVEELLEDLSSVPSADAEADFESSKEFEIVQAPPVPDPVQAAESLAPPDVEQIPSWEKTDPAIVVFEKETRQPETETVSAEKSAEAASVMDKAFLLDDEQTAADISAFLAQSRTEDAPPPAQPEDFVEPPTVIFTQNTIEETFNDIISDEAPRSVETTEVRIPTPEEVENENLIPIDDSSPLGEEPLPVENADQRDLIEEWHLQPAAEKPVERHAGDSTEMMSAVDAISPEYPPANLDQFSRDRFYVQPLIGADRFLLIDPHLLEFIISERLICRRGSISSYTGNLHFLPWLTEYEKTIPLIQVDGSGIVFLSDKRKEIFMLSLNNESIFVEANHLLVAQSALKVEPYMMGQTETGVSLSVVKVSGRGSLAVTCMTKPLTLNVYQAMPVNIPGDALIVWSGNLKSEFVHDDELRKIMMFSDEEEDVMLLRFSGNGDVVVEQGSLWGDRRAKK